MERNAESAVYFVEIDSAFITIHRSRGIFADDLIYYFFRAAEIWQGIEIFGNGWIHIFASKVNVDTNLEDRKLCAI
jgi:hypothetical protein